MEKERIIKMGEEQFLLWLDFMVNTVKEIVTVPLIDSWVSGYVSGVSHSIQYVKTEEEYKKAIKEIADAIYSLDIMKSFGVGEEVKEQIIIKKM